MTPKQIQSAIISTFTEQLTAHGLVLSAEVLADCAAQAATVIASLLDECEGCGHGHAKCCCDVCKYCDAKIGGYEPSERDLKLAPHDRECEECYRSTVRSAQRDRDREEHGWSRRDARYYADGENWRGE